MYRKIIFATLATAFVFAPVSESTALKPSAAARTKLRNSAGAASPTRTNTTKDLDKIIPRGDRWRGLVVSALGPGPSRCGVGPRDGNVAQNVGLKLNL